MNVTRQSKYTQPLLTTLERLGHATNRQLLESLRISYPDLTPTTVHRLSQRLAERGKIGKGPNNKDGEIRYDKSPVPHDHFGCQSCDNLRDLDVAEAFIPHIESLLDGCKITGRLYITGLCIKCKSKEAIK